MGITYYLRRDDNRTLFCLGKGTGDWEQFLGGGRAAELAPEDEAALAAAIAEEFENGGWHWTSDDVRCRMATESRRIAGAIVEWSGGRLFRFVTEDGFEDWEDDPDWYLQRAVTGTRYLRGGLPDLGESCVLVRDDGAAYDLSRGTSTWGDVLGSGHPISIGPEREAELAGAILGKLSSEPRRGSFRFRDDRELPGGCEGYAQHVARSIVEWSAGRTFRFAVDEHGDLAFGATGTRLLP